MPSVAGKMGDRETLSRRGMEDGLMAVYTELMGVDSAFANAREEDECLIDEY